MAKFTKLNRRRSRAVWALVMTKGFIDSDVRRAALQVNDSVARIRNARKPYLGTLRWARLTEVEDLLFDALDRLERMAWDDFSPTTRAAIDAGNDVLADFENAKREKAKAAAAENSREIALIFQRDAAYAFTRFESEAGVPRIHLIRRQEWARHKYAEARRALGVVD